MTDFPKKRIFVDWKAMFEKTRALQERIGSTALSFRPDQLVSDLNMGQKQLVEIMKAISTEVKVLAFDEPTSSLSAEEVSQLFKLIKQLTQQGISILYVTHRLNEVFAICDRVSVFKDGKYIGTEDTKDVKTSDVITMMIGREMNMFEKDPGKRIGDVRLEVKNLNRGDKVRNVSFSLKEGEILGMFGIVGSGRTETARLLFGLDKKESGNIILNEEETSIEHPIEAVERKLGFVSEDRRGEGLAVRLNVIQNTTMPFFKRFAKSGMINTKKEVEKVENLVKEFDVKTPGLETIVENLSGGNQQKISISKWVGSESDILVLDEPTRGIDVGAKAEVYRMMEHLSSMGKSIIMISSELPEILAMSDRLLVFRDGEIVREFEDVRGLSEEDVMNYAIDANAG
jgi:ribose transport system ATP-binding protein